jgi:3-oxoacyl-[acyl-carrier protein] reductase
MPASQFAKTKVALVSGGSRGIGLAIARAFASAGYRVIITGRDAGRLRDASDQLGGGAGVRSILCDVADPASVDHAFNNIRENCDGIDVLVNNAGVAHSLVPVEDFSLETWRQVIETNLTGTFLVTRAALAMMQAGSTIINNLSVAAIQPFAGMAAYNASKFGAMGFTQALREDVRVKGIRVIALLPGATDTAIWQQFWPGAPREKMISAETIAQIVLDAVSVPSNTTVEEIRIGPAAGPL